ncbi:hypothetical protein [Aeromonas veronii]|nr:hypothetical protein [Aeromonas veronii]MCX0434304.1 hypothetical protein [Aeromonas veronii]
MKHGLSLSLLGGIFIATTASASTAGRDRTLLMKFEQADRL